MRGPYMYFAPLLLLASARGAAASWPPNAGADAAAALAARVLGPSAADLFEFSVIDPGQCDAERGPCAVVRSGSREGKVAIAGSTPVEMAYALAQYCQSELRMGFAWVRSGGFQTAVSNKALPLYRARLTNPICHPSGPS